MKLLVKRIRLALQSRTRFLSTVSQKLTFSVVGLSTLAISSPALSLCFTPDILGGGYVGTWNSSWGSPTGEYKSVLKISVYSGKGISGTYENGTFKGNFIRDARGILNYQKVVGTWQRTQGSSGGPCQYGRFEFNQVGERIFGKWSYCNDKPTWSWNSVYTCNENAKVHLNRGVLHILQYLG